MIQQNWQGIPQLALPSYMLPDGHIPSDRTLYLLAMLSKEMDKSEASQLLAEVINCRCQDLDPEIADRTLKTDDVQHVLNSLRASSNHTSNPQVSQANETPSANISTKRFQPSSKTTRQSHAPESPAATPKATPETPHSSPNLTTAAAVQGYFTTALQAWLDLSNIDPELEVSSTVKKTILNTSKDNDRKLRIMIMERSKAAGIMGKAYVTPAAVKTLKRYLAGLTLELSSSFPLPDISTCDEVVEVFQAIHSIFLHESKHPTQERPGIGHVSEG